MINVVALLVNPAAGRGRGRRVGASAAALLREPVAVRELAGTGIDDAAVFARRAVRDGCGALVVCGGDGIVHVALQAVGATHTALGIIPAGSGNDFARAAGVPLGDVSAAVAGVRGGRTAPMDLTGLRAGSSGRSLPQVLIPG